MHEASKVLNIVECAGFRIGYKSPIFGASGSKSHTFERHLGPDTSIIKCADPLDFYTRNRHNGLG